MEATVLQERTIPVKSLSEIEGVKILTIDFHGEWENYRNLPNLISYSGLVYGKSSFNSDMGEAVYRDDALTRYASEIVCPLPKRLQTVGI